MRPTYLGLGPPRTATTTVHLSLLDHPEIEQAKEKELHWFNSSGWSTDAKAVAAYENNWQDSEKLVRGEITPTYISFPDRILSLYPDIKFFIIRRNPVDRLISHLRLDLALAMRNRKMSGRDFAQYKDKVIDSFQKKIRAKDFTGFVIEQSHNHAIDQWRQRLSEDQLLILNFEDLTRDSLSQKKEMNRLYTFLGVSTVPMHQFRHVNNFPGLTVKLDPDVLELLEHHYSKEI